MADWLKCPLRDTPLPAVTESRSGILNRYACQNGWLFFTFFIKKGMLNPKNAGTIFFNNSFILHFEFQNDRHFYHIFYDFHLFTSLLQLFGIRHTYSWILH